LKCYTRGRPMKNYWDVWMGYKQKRRSKKLMKGFVQLMLVDI
jgi:hypothetical protein